MSQPHSCLTPTRGGDAVSIVRRRPDTRAPACGQGGHQRAPTTAVPLQGARILARWILACWISSRWILARRNLAHWILAHWNLAHHAFSCSPWRGNISSPHKQFRRRRWGQAVQSRFPGHARAAHLDQLNRALAQALSHLPGFHNSFWRHHPLCRYVLVARSAISSKQRVWIIVYSQH